MDKESKLSPAVQPFVPKVQRGFEPREPSTASTNTLTRQNPYLTEQSSRRNQSGQPSRPRPSTTEGLRGDAHGKHGYSNSRRARGTPETNAPRERSINDQQTTASKSRSDFISQERNMGRRSLEVPKKGFRGARSAPNTSERSKAVLPDTFEVKMADFPELVGQHDFEILVPDTRAPATQQKLGTCWGSASPPPTPHSQSRAPTTKITLARREQRPGPIRDVAETRPTLTVMSGQPAEAGTDLVGQLGFGILAPDTPATQQKRGTCWGSASPPLTPHSQSRAPTTKITLARREQRPGPIRDVAETRPTLTVMSGQPAEAGTESNGSGPAVTSWANVASQPPKKPVPKEKTSTGPSSQKEKMAVQQEGEKKKKRKKKKKSKAAGEDAEESEELLVHQEPPKFEDEEEFPDLAFAIAGNPRVQVSTVFPNSGLAKPGKQVQENLREGPGLQPDDQNKDTVSSGKPLSTETKKGQVAQETICKTKSEKTGGKKSKVPVQLDIGNMLAVLEKKQQSQKSKQDAKPVILSVGGGLPVVGGGLPVSHKNSPVPKKLPWQQDKIAHNPLDSTSPLVKKGKQREVPKLKKPTPLKRVILKEREERKRNRLLEERGLVPPSEEFTPDRNVTDEPCNAVETDQEQSGLADKISSPTVCVVPEEDQTEEDEEETREAEENGEADHEKDTPGTGEQTTQAQPYPPNRPKIHSRKFREYCSQVLSKDVDECVTNLLKELVRFQDRLYQKDPMKARMKRRLVMGLREVLKHLKLKKVKCVIISPNCERIQSKGGLDEALHTIIDTCREQGVPFVFALSRKALGRCVNKVVPVTLVGVFNYDGAEDHYHKMIELSSEARRAYEVMIENLEMTSQAEQENCEDQPSTESQPSPVSAESEEPEYIKLWKKLLEKECSHNVLYNFEEHLSAASKACDSKAQMEEEERS